MALHGLAEMTLGVPDVEAVGSFYRDFGLTETAPGVFGSADGGEQLRLVTRPYRQLVELVLAADDPDDVGRVRSAAESRSIEVRGGADDVSLREPVIGFGVRVRVRDRIAVPEHVLPEMNTAGHTARANDRAPAIFDRGPARPRRLGHVLYTSADAASSRAFLTDVLGFKVSDTSGALAFLRCGSDHHNVGLADAPVSFFHHSSWEVNDVDEIGQGAQSLLATDPARNVWGLGRHFLGSNLFWYFRDPSGNYAEYFSDMDQIPELAEWDGKDWPVEVSLNAWGPPVPPDFVVPSDVDEIVRAMEAT